MMKNLLIAPLAGILLASCTTQTTNFASMSTEQLMAYNEGKPVLKQIYCTEEKRTGSHIRKNWCRSVEDWVDHNIRTLMALDTLNIPGGSVLRGGN
jgi:hypothetical protein